MAGLMPHTSLSMTPLPVLDQSGENLAPPPTLDWGQAAGNLEDAKAAAAALKGLIDEAVFLDEETYSNTTNITRYQQRVQLQQRKMRELENEAAALRAEIERKDHALAAANARAAEFQQQVAQLEQELENNTEVFKLHYQELITRNEEIARLKTVIEGLSGHG